MKAIGILAGAALVAATLAACSPGIHGKFGYSVDFQNGKLVTHAHGQPNAYIDSDGSLRIGDRDIAVTPQQRALLKDYYGQSRTVVDTGIATGKAGVTLGAHAVGNAIESIFSGDPQKASTALDAQTNAISASASKLCAGIEQLHATQKEIAAQLPAFKPYQASDQQMRCEVTITHRVTAADGQSGSAKVIETKKQATTH